jgi:hypothetical protein
LIQWVGGIKGKKGGQVKTLASYSYGDPWARPYAEFWFAKINRVRELLAKLLGKVLDRDILHELHFARSTRFIDALLSSNAEARSRMGDSK